MDCTIKNKKNGDLTKSRRVKNGKRFEISQFREGGVWTC
jgi:hypothetical protein